ncbi:MAG TPA: MipA/OmpV family protein [Gemmatimonadales bacterium]|nr:MipA/OmpV family protein [Gemmatimonadales bacterium]
MRSIVTAVLVFTSTATLAAQQAPTPAAPSWEITLGGGALLTPSYAGAEEYDLFPFPLTRVSYRQRIYLGQSTAGNGVGLGVWAIRSGGFGMAAEVGVLPNRPHSRADALAGMENRDFVGTASGTVSYTLGGIEAAVSVTRGLNDGAGTLGSTRLSYTGSVGGRLITTIGVGATFADQRQMRWDFGVTDREAARRQALIDAGDDRLEADEGRAYRPDAGLRHLGASLSLTYPMTAHWALVGFGGVDRLSSEANASPLVRRREQVSGGFGLGYRF